MSERKAKQREGIAVLLAELIEKVSKRLDRYALALNQLSAKVANTTDGTLVRFSKVDDDIADMNERFERVTNAQLSEIDKLKADADRAWTLNASRDILHRQTESKLAENTDKVLLAIQKLNERLSMAEGKIANYGADVVRLAEHLNSNKAGENLWEAIGDLRQKVGSVRLEIKGETGMLGECIASQNQRLEKLEAKAKRELRRSLPSVLRLLLDPNFVRIANQAGYVPDSNMLVAAVQELIDESELGWKFKDSTVTSGGLLCGTVQVAPTAQDPLAQRKP